MIDDLAELAATAAVDVVAGKAASRHRWARVLRALGGVLFVALVATAIYVTLRYS